MITAARPSAGLTKVESAELLSHERTIEACLGPYQSVIVALATIKIKGLYREFGSFKDYLKKRWKGRFHAVHLNRLIKAVSVRENLSAKPIGFAPPEHESQARELGSLTPEQQKTVWRQANHEAANGGPRPTAARLKELKELLDLAGPAPAEEPKQTHLAAQMKALAQRVQKLRERTTKMFGAGRASRALALLDDFWDEVTRLAEVPKNPLA